MGGQEGCCEGHIGPCRPDIQQVSDQSLQGASSEPSGGPRGRCGGQGIKRPILAACDSKGGTILLLIPDRHRGLVFLLLLFLLPLARAPAAGAPTLFGVSAPEAAQHHSPGGARVPEQPQGPREHGGASAGPGHGGACSGRSRAAVAVGLRSPAESPPGFSAPRLPPARASRPFRSPHVRPLRAPQPKREGSERRSQGRAGRAPGAGTGAAPAPRPSEPRARGPH